MTREHWRPVRGWATRYEVSDQGRVRSRRTGQLLAPAPDQGYPHVNLYRNGHRITRHVHVLVLQAFRGPRRRDQVCRHLNGRRDDNRLSNIRWGTRAQNEADRRRHGRSGHKLTAALARRIRRAKGLQREVADQFAISAPLVSMIRSGRVWAGA